MQVGILKGKEKKKPFQKLYIDLPVEYPRSKSCHAWIFFVVDGGFFEEVNELVNFLVNEVF